MNLFYVRYTVINYLTKLQNKRGNYPKQVLLQDNI